MKKLLLILFTLNLLLCSCGKEKEFDENLTVAFTEMQKMWDLSTSTYDDIHKTVMNLLVNNMNQTKWDHGDGEIDTFFFFFFVEWKKRIRFAKSFDCYGKKGEKT